MKTIKNAVFLKSESELDNFKGFGIPEIVVLGRSNVGKSSFINMLSGNSKLAKVSATQGKTKLVNFFLFNKEFVLVDLPGYGYAQTSKLEMQRWEKMINGYLEKSKNLVSSILIVDIRHKPTAQDVQMLDYLAFNNIPVTVVATKYDKIKKSERLKKLTDIAQTLKIGIENIYLISSETSFGKETIIDRIYQFINGV